MRAGASCEAVWARRGTFAASLVIAAAASAVRAGPADDAQSTEVKARYHPRWHVRCAPAEQVCPPIRTAFQDASETVRVFQGRRVNQHLNGGFGLPLMQVAGRPYFHTGADLGWFRTGEPVFAVADGIVRISQSSLRRAMAEQGVKLPTKGPMEYGNMIVIEHHDPEGGRFSSLYAHLGDDRRVQVGDLVSAGQQIGTIGRKAAIVNGGYEPHLHFGILKGGFWEPGDRVFAMKTPEGDGQIVRLEEAGEVRSRVTIEPEPTGPVRFDLYDRTIEVARDGDGFTIPSFLLHAFEPAGLGGRYAGYRPDMGDWTDPVAFLRERGADRNPAAVLHPTPLGEREPAPDRYVVDGPAPAWHVDTWLRPKDRPDLEVKDFRGRAVCLFFVQATCPGCRSHGLPALAAVGEHFRGDDRVAVVAIHPSVGRRSAGSPQKVVERLANQLDSSVFVGHCAGKAGPPQIAHDYQVGATPWTVIIDADGVVQFSNFTVRPTEIIRRVEECLAGPEPPANATKD